MSISHDARNPSGSQHWTPARIRKATPLPKPEGARFRYYSQENGAAIRPPATPLELLILRHIVDHGDVLDVAQRARPRIVTTLPGRRVPTPVYSEWLLVPMPRAMIDALAAFDAGLEDFEDVGDSEPSSDAEPDCDVEPADEEREFTLTEETDQERRVPPDGDEDAPLVPGYGNGTFTLDVAHCDEHEVTLPEDPNQVRRAAAMRPKAARLGDDFEPDHEGDDADREPDDDGGEGVGAIVTEAARARHRAGLNRPLIGVYQAAGDDVPVPCAFVPLPLASGRRA
jgi:hypothetical protein